VTYLSCCPRWCITARIENPCRLNSGRNWPIREILLTLFIEILRCCPILKAAHVATPGKRPYETHFCPRFLIIALDSRRMQCCLVNCWRSDALDQSTRISSGISWNGESVRSQGADHDPRISWQEMFDLLCHRHCCSSASSRNHSPSSVDSRILWENRPTLGPTEGPSHRARRAPGTGPDIARRTGIGTHIGG
jgi:hypothetical protein